MRNKADDADSREAKDADIRSEGASESVDETPTESGHVAHSPDGSVDQTHLMSPAGDGEQSTTDVTHARDESDKQDL